MIYGDFSQRMERTYTVYSPEVKLANGTTIFNHPDSPRGKYIKAKRLYKLRKQNN